MNTKAIWTVIVLAVAVGSAGCQTAAVPSKESIYMNRYRYQAGKNTVSFQSGGATLVGSLYLPRNYREGDKLAAVIVTGSWTTVKEMMAGTYARRLAEQGVAALAFDFRFFGESGGEPRQFESADAKVEDIKNAVSFLSALPIVASDRIGGLGICASAGYMAAAAKDDRRLKALAFVAPWLHDAEIVKQIYGGEEGVNSKIAAAREAKRIYRSSGKVIAVPAISTTNKDAAMFGEFGYYLDPGRGAIPQWKNEFAVMSWEDWLTFDGISQAKKISQPTILVHSQEAAVPQGARQFYADLRGPKKIVWTNGSQFDFYDQDQQINQSIKITVEHFGQYLRE